VPSTAGLHLCARLRPDTGVDLGGVRDRARRLGVAVETLDAYYAGPPQAGLVLGYGLISAERIGDGLRLLRHAFTDRP
jgi:GntR family transcriptional regulator/MocR family aminotransferase